MHRLGRAGIAVVLLVGVLWAGGVAIARPGKSVVVCENSFSHTVRIYGSGCIYGREVKHVWPTGDEVPALCYSPVSRFVKLSPVNGCDAGLKVLKASSGSRALVCADTKSGVLRWPRTGVCWWEHTSIMLRVKTANATSAAAEAPATTTTSTTSTTSTTAVVVPSVSLTATWIQSNTWPKAVTVTTNVAGTVYFAEGDFVVKTVADITSAPSYRWAKGTVTSANTPTLIAIDVDAVTNGYYRVFVANSQGVLSAPATNIVTISIPRASTATSTTPSTPLTAPAFTLSSSTESKAQNVTIAGYAINSSGGVIASYAISPSAPTGTAFSTSTGLLTGTPSVVQGATAYTITATNATGSTSQTFTLTVTVPLTCATGGSCTVGVDTGPGGGIVFYYSVNPFTSTGSTCDPNCHYLEAAPAGWIVSSTPAGQTNCSTAGTTSADPQCSWSGTTSTAIGSTAQGTTIGTGYANTSAMILQNGTGGYAATAARAYQGGSKTDWFLPSNLELNQLCRYAWNLTVSPGTETCKGMTGEIRTGFSMGLYWSSTESNWDGSYILYFGEGDLGTQYKYREFSVRPVRAF